MLNTSYYLSIFFVFIVLAYMISVDQNVARYIILLGKQIKLFFERLIYMIRYHPSNPISNFLIVRRANKIAKDLQKEFDLKNEKID